MKGWFEKKEKELADVFNQKDLKDTRVVIDVQQTPSEKAHWYRHQIIESAHTAGHYADFSYFAAWCRLRVRVEDLDLRFVASLHGAGRDIGVMAVTTFGELAEPDTADKKGANHRKRKRRHDERCIQVRAHRECRRDQQALRRARGTLGGRPGRGLTQLLKNI
jgi:hypothetical protein